MKNEPLVPRGLVILHLHTFFQGLPSHNNGMLLSLHYGLPFLAPNVLGTGTQNTTGIHLPSDRSTLNIPRLTTQCFAESRLNSHERSNFYYEVQIIK